MHLALIRTPPAPRRRKLFIGGRSASSEPERSDLAAPYTQTKILAMLREHFCISTHVRVMDLAARKVQPRF